MAGSKKKKKALYLKRTSNGGSVSNQGVCGLVGGKQKVQMQSWVLARSHHVGRDTEHRHHGRWSNLFSYVLSSTACKSCFKVIVHQCRTGHMDQIKNLPNWIYFKKLLNDLIKKKNYIIHLENIVDIFICNVYWETMLSFWIFSPLSIEAKRMT